MSSLASQLLNHYNGVQPIADTKIGGPDAPYRKEPKPKAVRREPPVMTEGMLKNKEMLRNTLRCGVWTIDFTKVDGTPTIMECTLDPKLLPVLDPAMLNVKPRNEEPEAEHLLHVYATDRQGWRSFVVPNVTKIYKKVENQ